MTTTKNSHRRPPKDAPLNVTIAAVVKEAVRRYKRDCWWADTEDLTQHGWVVALEAHKTFKPERMDDFYWYAWRAVVIQLRNHLWRQSAPVSAPQRKLSELRGVFRDTVENVPEVPEEVSGADQELHLARLRAEVRAAAEALDPALTTAAFAGDLRAMRSLAKRGAKDRTLRRAAAKAGILQHLHNPQ